MDVVLFHFPTISDALTWSDEGDIAVAVDEEVQILIPRLSRKSASPQPGDLWHTPINIKINEFNLSEIYLEIPISAASFSAGEELSTNHIIQLKWSFSGLDPFRRCALAILTSNLLLSLWVPTSQPRTINSSWERVLILNEALMQRYEQLNPEDQRKKGKDRSEAMRRYQRIRSFSWAPLVRLEANDEPVHLIAVANDEMQIFVQQVEHTQPDEWKSYVLSEISIRADQVPRPTLDWTFDDYQNNSCHIYRSTWSHWVELSNRHQLSILAYASSDHIGLISVEYFRNKDGEMKLETSMLNTRFPVEPIRSIHGPIKFHKLDAESTILVMFIHDEVISKVIDIRNLNQLRTYSRERPEWSGISGSVSTVDSVGGVTLHTSIMNDLSEETQLDFTLPELQTSESYKSNWHKMMLEYQKQYADENSLHGNARTLVWGMDTSFLGDYVATVFCHVPSKTPAYLMNNEKRSRLILQHPDSSEPKQLQLGRLIDLSSKSDLSYEAIAFSCMLHLSTMSENERLNTPVDTLLERLVIPSQEILAEPLMDLKLHQEDLGLAIKHQIRKISRNGSSRFLHLQALLHSLLGHGRHESTLQAPIFSLISSILTQSYDDDVVDTATKNMANMYKLFNNHKHPADEGDIEMQDIQSPEICEICDAKIPWQYFDHAYCESGHQFVRCGLSFMSIQAPGISKFCGLCSTSFLRNSALQTEVDDGRSKNESLAKTIFMACDTCVYCGGKFVE